MISINHVPEFAKCGDEEADDEFDSNYSSDDKVEKSANWDLVKIMVGQMYASTPTLHMGSIFAAAKTSAVLGIAANTGRAHQGGSSADGSTLGPALQAQGGVDVGNV